MSRYPFPRARGDTESAARARAFAWRGVLAFVVIYLALLVAVVWKFVAPALVSLPVATGAA
jgi:uncharacterized membrane protein